MDDDGTKVERKNYYEKKNDVVFACKRDTNNDYVYRQLLGAVIIQLRPLIPFVLTDKEVDAWRNGEEIVIKASNPGDGAEKTSNTNCNDGYNWSEDAGKCGGAFYSFTGLYGF